VKSDNRRAAGFAWRFTGQSRPSSMATSARSCGRPGVRVVASRCRLMKALHPRLSVALFPDSCALFPLEQGGRLPSGANRSTPRGESLHPPGLNWSESLQRRGTSSRFVRAIPDSCAFRIWHGMCMCFLACAEPRGRSPRATKATRATVRGPLLHTRLQGFSFPSNSLSIPPKEILS
jgi:hypothetical protein